jgi:eukaryotic-like serine/threonine-protein kinase
MSCINCWEFKKCGREPNGHKVAELGVCPASIETRADGIHSGVNGGRCCWVVSGTFCGDKVQGTYAAKLINCVTCEFYQNVIHDVGKNRIDSMEILSKLEK